MRRVANPWKRFYKALLCAAACSIVLAGCLPATLQPNVRSDNVPGDPCSGYREPLLASSDQLDQWDFMVDNAFGGAVLGGIAGALLHGRASDAAVGAAIGAAGGALLGYRQYLNARQQQARSRQELIDGINGDASADTARVREVSDAIRQLGACRRDQVDRIKSELKNGSITRQQALARADAVKAASARDRGLIEEVLGKVDKRYDTYVDAKAEVLGVERTRVAAAAPSQAQIAAARAKDLAPLSGTYQVKSGANIRQGPSTSTAKVGYLPADRKITVTGATRDGKWYAFDHQGGTAFIYSSLVTTAEAEDGVIGMGRASRTAHRIVDEEDENLERDLESLFASIGEEEGEETPG